MRGQLSAAHVVPEAASTVVNWVFHDSRVHERTPPHEHSRDAYPPLVEALRKYVLSSGKLDGDDVPVSVLATARPRPAACGRMSTMTVRPTGGGPPTRQTVTRGTLQRSDTFAAYDTVFVESYFVLEHATAIRHRL